MRPTSPPGHVAHPPKEPLMERLVLLLAVTAAALAGCAVYTPQGAVVVDPPTSTSPKGGVGNGGCPPGQAKKGYC